MNDVVWYSRLVIWFGAAVLLLQAVTGRSVGVVTALAVVALLLGFLTFLGGLTLGDRRLVAATPGVQQLPGHTPGEPLWAEAPPAPVPQTGINAPSEPTSGLDPTGEQAVTAHVPEPVGGSEPSGTERTPAVETLPTFLVQSGSTAEGAVCRRCRADVEAGEVAVSCPVCGLEHHAACWTENGSQCARPGCTGTGVIAE